MAEKKTKYDRTKGRKPVQLLPTTDQHRQLRLAAAERGIPLTHFLIEAGLREAKKILEKIAN